MKQLVKLQWAVWVVVMALGDESAANARLVDLLRQVSNRVWGGGGGNTWCVQLPYSLSPYHCS